MTKKSDARKAEQRKQQTENLRIAADAWNKKTPAAKKAARKWTGKKEN